LSTIDKTSTPPITTTTPDDVFFILQNVISRLLSAASLENVQVMTKNVFHVLEKEYAAVIRRKLDDVYRATGGAGGQRNEKAQQEHFIVSTSTTLGIQ
jgi:hypothetical protein